ncbi:MAG: hypothetical protein BGO26_06715 [Actinobacteria bacterium 69-20]|nr:hypothetical protein [Actinomycetota bacterium]OJV28126.1 MAG: hypothetical protein BGO26_06715 [Actinobacteria bacterium 69-20]
MATVRRDGGTKVDSTAVEVEPEALRLNIHIVTPTAVTPGGDELAITTLHDDRRTTVIRRRQ